VDAAIFSPDGSQVLTSNFKKAQLWEAGTGMPIGEPVLHEGFVKQMAFSPNGTCFLTADSTGTVQLWEVATRKPLGKTMRHEDSVEAVAFSPDGSKVVTASGDKMARLWNAHTGEPLSNFLMHDKEVVCVVFAPNGNSVATGSFDGTVALWDIASGMPVWESVREIAELSHLEFNPDGTTLLAAGHAMIPKACLLDASKGQLHSRFYSRYLTFSPDGSHVLSIDKYGGALMYDTSSKKQFGPRIGYEYMIRSATFSPDGKRLLFVCTDSVARIRTVPLRDVLANADSAQKLSQLGYAVAGIGFNESGRWRLLPNQERVIPEFLNSPWKELVSWLRNPEVVSDPVSGQTRRQLAESELAMAELTRSISETAVSFEQAIKLKPDLPLVRMRLANVLEEAFALQSNKGKDPDYLAAHGKASLLRQVDFNHLPRDPDTLAGAAKLLNEASCEAAIGVGKATEPVLPRALLAADKALSLAPEHSEALRQRAWALWRLEHFDESLAASRRLISLRAAELNDFRTAIFHSALHGKRELLEEFSPEGRDRFLHDAAIPSEIACTYYQLGDKALARDHFELSRESLEKRGEAPWETRHAVPGIGV